MGLTMLVNSYLLSLELWSLILQKSVLQWIIQSSFASIKSRISSIQTSFQIITFAARLLLQICKNYRFALSKSLLIRCNFFLQSNTRVYFTELRKWLKSLEFNLKQCIPSLLKTFLGFSCLYVKHWCDPTKPFVKYSVLITKMHD